MERSAVPGWTPPAVVTLRAGRARLDLPPPYRPHPGEPVYEISAGERVAQVAEGDLVGPLRELVRAVLADGWDIS